MCLGSFEKRAKVLVKAEEVHDQRKVRARSEKNTREINRKEGENVKSLLNMQFIRFIQNDFSHHVFSVFLFCREYNGIRRHV